VYQSIPRPGFSWEVLAPHPARFRSLPEVLFEALQYYVHLILTAFMLPRWFEQRMRLHPSPVPVSHSYDELWFLFTKWQMA